MKTLLILIVTLFTFNSITVYICDSKSSEVYHKTKNCSGIKNCTHEVKEVTVSEATSTYNRRACKICYK